MSHTSGSGKPTTEELIARTCSRFEQGPTRTRTGEFRAPQVLSRMVRNPQYSPHMHFHQFAEEEDIRAVQQDLLSCSASVEREIEAQEQIRTNQLNEMCMLSARISEVNDHVEKARLRENELAERVTRWVEYLREEKQKMLSRGSRLYATGTLSANISDDIEYNISMLMQMRQRVDSKILEIRQRKKEHKQQLRQMKNEMLDMHRDLGDWDRKYDELCTMIRRLEVSRRQVQERIKEQQQKETTAKLLCIEMDKKLHDIFGSDEVNEGTFREDSNIETTKYHFSMTTTSESKEGPTMAEAVRNCKQVKL